jgi:hypothetical protein
MSRQVARKCTIEHCTAHLDEADDGFVVTLMKDKKVLYNQFHVYIGDADRDYESLHEIMRDVSRHE